MFSLSWRPEVGGCGDAEVGCCGLEKGVVRFVAQKTGREMVVPMVPALAVVLRNRKAVCGEEAVFVHPSRAEMYERSGSSRLSAEFSGMLFDAGLIDRDPRLAGKRYKKLTPARDGKEG